jgi:flagellin
MLTTVNTNVGAMIALQNLNATSQGLADVQNRVSTGLKVDGARTNAAVYNVAQNMRADVGALNAVKSSLDRATSIADVALAAGESISDLLIKLREQVTAAMDPSIDTASRTAYNQDFRSTIAQIRTAIGTASFDGANVLNGTIANGIGFLADADATASLIITLRSENMSLSGTIITLSTAASILTVTTATANLARVQTSITNVNSALARLGATAKRVEMHNTFISKLNDSLTSGIGNLVDADLAKESARLQALQIKQQLGTQALSIANQAPQQILSLFRQ